MVWNPQIIQQSESNSQYDANSKTAKSFVRVPSEIILGHKWGLVDDFYV